MNKEQAHTLTHYLKYLQELISGKRTFVITITVPVISGINTNTVLSRRHTAVTKIFSKEKFNQHRAHLRIYKVRQPITKVSKRCCCNMQYHCRLSTCQREEIESEYMWALCVCTFANTFILSRRMPIHYNKMSYEQRNIYTYKV